MPVPIKAEGQDREEVILQNSPAFWKMIAKRRSEKTISLQELKKRLGQK